MGARINPQHPLSHGLIGWWLFNESGTRVSDASGLQHHGTLVNSTGEASRIGSIHGGGLLLDGTNDHVMVPFKETQNASQVTIAMWIKPTNFLAFGSLLEQGSSLSAGYGVFINTNGQFGHFFEVTDGTANQSGGATTALVEETWSHVAITYNGVISGDIIYINGLAHTPTGVSGLTRNNAGGLVVASSSNLYFGSRSGTTLPFNGAYDDIRIYNRVLSQDEITQLMSDPYANVLRVGHRQIQRYDPATISPPLRGAEVMTVQPRQGVYVDRTHRLFRNLLLWFPLAEGGGPIARDVGPNRLTHTTGTFSPTTAWRGGGITGQAMRFNGVDDTLLFGHVITSNWDGTVPISASAWFRANAQLIDGEYCIVGKQEAAGNRSGWGLHVQVVGGSYRLRYEWRDTIDVRVDVHSGAGTIEPDRWYHVLATYNGTKLASGIEIYINGVRTQKVTALDALGGFSTATSANLAIGSVDDGNTYFSGSLANVRVWSRVLTQAEAEMLYLDPWAGALLHSHYRYLYQGSEAVFLTIPDRHPHVAKSRPLLDPRILQQGGSSLAAWFPFNEGSGTVAQDQQGQHHIATLTNMDPTSAWVGTLHGGGLQFDGSNDYLTVPMHPSLQPPRLTLAVWVRLDARPLTFASVVEAGDATADGWSLIVDHTGSYGFIFKTAGGSQVGGYYQPRQLGHWTHVAVTYNGEISGDALYIDGQPVAIGSLVSLSRVDQGGDVAAPASALTFASRAGSSRFLTGALDDVRVYREALSASAIAALYDSSANGQVDLGSRMLLLGSTVRGGSAARIRRFMWRT